MNFSAKYVSNSQQVSAGSSLFSGNRSPLIVTSDNKGARRNMKLATMTNSVSSLHNRRQQNLDRTLRIGSDYGPDNGLYHGSLHGYSQKKNLKEIQKNQKSFTS